MKKWSFIILLVMVLALLPNNQIKWNTEASTDQSVFSKNEIVLHNAPSKEINQQNASSFANSFMPKINRSYTYEPAFESEKQKTYIAKQNPSLNNSIELMEDDYIGYTYIESEHELSFSIAYSDIFLFSLSYPFIENTSITDTEYLFDGTTETTQVFVKSTSATVSTQAGTFQDVVILTYPNGSDLFLAKEYGIIRITDFAGNVTTELISAN